MSYVLAAARPDTFAAIAPVAGYRWETSEGSGLFPPFLPRVPSRPVPLMHIQGTSDVLVPYDGGGIPLPGFEGIEVPAFEDTLNEWVTNNVCDIPPTVSDLLDISAVDASTVTVLSFEDCSTYNSVHGHATEANVVHYRVNNGGHSWPVLDADREAALTAFEETYGPDLLPVYFPLNSDFDASAEIWKFFEQHTLPVGPLPPGIVDNPGRNNPGLGGKLPPGLRDGLPPQTHHSVPEPASATLLLLGCSIGFLARRYSARS